MCRHYPCIDCGDTEHTCLAWDGKGVVSHNLVVNCPNNVLEVNGVEKDFNAIEKCEYRMAKIPSIL
jgi:hypothetical protein